jgi:hypothetical protein
MLQTEYSLEMKKEWHIETHPHVIDDFIIDNNENVLYTSEGGNVILLDGRTGDNRVIVTKIAEKNDQSASIRRIEVGPSASTLVIYRAYAENTVYKIGVWEYSDKGIIKSSIETAFEPIDIAWVNDYHELWSIDAGGVIHILKMNDEKKYKEEQIINGNFTEILAIAGGEVLAIENIEDTQEYSKDIICVFRERKRIDIEYQDCDGCDLIGKDPTSRYLVLQLGECNSIENCMPGIHRYDKQLEAQILDLPGLAWCGIRANNILVFEFTEEPGAIISLYEFL